MPYVEPLALGGNTSQIASLQQRVQMLEARTRSLGNGALTVTDSNGNTVMVIGNLGNDQYGIAVLDESGNERALMGLLPSGDFGFMVLDTSGNSAEILPQYSVYHGPAIALPSSTGSLGVAVTANIGASGAAIVTLSAELLPPPASASLSTTVTLQPHVGSSAVGAPLTQAIAVNGSGDSVSSAVTATIQTRVSGLTPGPVTFTIYGSGTTTSEAQYISMTVQPI